MKSFVEACLPRQGSAAAIRLNELAFIAGESQRLCLPIFRKIMEMEECHA